MTTFSFPFRYYVQLCEEYAAFASREPDAVAGFKRWAKDKFGHDVIISPAQEAYAFSEALVVHIEDPDAALVFKLAWSDHATCK